MFAQSINSLKRQLIAVMNKGIGMREDLWLSNTMDVCSHGEIFLILKPSSDKPE